MKKNRKFKQALRQKIKQVKFTDTHTLYDEFGNLRNIWKTNRDFIGLAGHGYGGDNRPYIHDGKRIWDIK